MPAPPNTTSTNTPAPAPAARRQLSTLDKWLPVWIGLAMIAGLLLGRFIPALADVLTRMEVAGISVPIGLGLLVMMYPVLAKVRYDKIAAVTGDKKLLVSSLVLNWLLGPAVMFALAWLFLPDLPEYRTGLIIVGLARCIAMVVIWNDLACGDREATAVLVAINSIFQVIAFSFLGWFYLTILPGWLGLDTQGRDVSVGQIALNVLVFLGVPLVAGFATRWIGEKRKGRAWYEEKFTPRVGPWALYGLLFTIVLLFALQGEAITQNPLDVARIALPLLVYFAFMLFACLLLGKGIGIGYARSTTMAFTAASNNFNIAFAVVITQYPRDVAMIALPLLVYFAFMWFAGLLLGKGIGLGYARSTTLAFTAAGNNFELAIAVPIGTFGATSGQALAGVVGPLIEV